MLSKLNQGETAILAVKKVVNNKISVEFAEKMQTSSQATVLNALSLFNAGDPAFETKARRAWVVGTIENIANLFKLDVSKLTDLQEGESEEIFIKNPSTEINGTKLFFKLRVRETTEANDYQKANIETTAKRKGKNGDYITSNGKYIFSNTDVVLLKEGEVAPHQLLKGDVVASVTTEQSIPSLVGTL